MLQRLLALLFLVLLCASLSAAEPAKLTVANYDRVALGSNLQAVQRVLGKEAGRIFDAKEDKLLVWREGDRIVNVRIKNGKVVSKVRSGF